MLKRFLILLFPVCVFAQPNIPLSKDAEYVLQYHAVYLNDSIPLFTNMKPVIENRYQNLYLHALDSAVKHNSEAGMLSLCVITFRDLSKEHVIDSRHTGWLYSKLKVESLINIHDTSTKFHMTIDPLFNFQMGKDNEDKTGEKLYTNTRGVIARGDIGSDFSFETSFLENQSTFPKYLNAFADTFKVIPGQGRWKRFKKNGYDYAMASGYVSYSPSKHFNFQLGHGKHFVGDGYRSLLLSDFAYNYPYLRITTSYSKIQYTQMYAVFMNPNNGTTTTGTETLYQKKAASFQMLSWNIHKRVQLGLFQGLIWQAADSKNDQHINFNYFNPIIFSNAIAYGMHNTHNVLLGSTIKIRPLKTISIYGQYVVDDIATEKGSLHNKQGYQIGIRGIDLFKIRSLNFLVEYNSVRPYTYASENSEQSYSHYNQSLAHPLGANFNEAVIKTSYRWKDFFIYIKFTSANIGADSSGTNYGSNIFKQDNLVYARSGMNMYEQNQGVKAKLNTTDAKIGYIINPVTNMSLSAGILMRDYQYASISSKTNWFYVAFRTSLSNIYYDF